MLDIYVSNGVQRAQSLLKRLRSGWVSDRDDGGRCEANDGGASKAKADNAMLDLVAAV